MPSLINTDNAGNTFLNYITPVSSGIPTNFNNHIQTFLTNAGWLWGNFGAYYGTRPPAPGLETKSGTISDTTARIKFYNLTNPQVYVSANNSNVSGYITNSFSGGNIASDITYMVCNDYAFSVACFTSTSRDTLRYFLYVGYLREPSFTGLEAPAGCIIMSSAASSNKWIRPIGVNINTLYALSSAADAITSPPIVCTAGTDPGDGSETFTDIVIRDAAAPNNPVGKLWNCIDMPATCNVGELWRNTGAHDGDASASEQDTYLCVMPWGTRKLGMRVWTENVT